MAPQKAFIQYFIQYILSILFISNHKKNYIYTFCDTYKKIFQSLISFVVLKKEKYYELQIRSMLSQLHMLIFNITYIFERIEIKGYTHYKQRQKYIKQLIRKKGSTLMKCELQDQHLTLQTLNYYNYGLAASLVSRSCIDVLDLSNYWDMIGSNIYLEFFVCLQICPLSACCVIELQKYQYYTQLEKIIKVVFKLRVLKTVI
ncbi:hypothetical protein pb186bvf_003136 [Paramecium bursaria]